MLSQVSRNSSLSSSLCEYNRVGTSLGLRLIRWGFLFARKAFSSFQLWQCCVLIQSNSRHSEQGGCRGLRANASSLPTPICVSRTVKNRFRYEAIKMSVASALMALSWQCRIEARWKNVGRIKNMKDRSEKDQWQWQRRKIKIVAGRMRDEEKIQMRVGSIEEIEEGKRKIQRVYVPGLVTENRTAA